MRLNSDDQKRPKAAKPEPHKSVPPKATPTAPAPEDLQPPMPVKATTLVFAAIMLGVLLVLHVNNAVQLESPWVAPIAILLLIGVQYIALVANRSSAGLYKEAKKQRQESRDARMPTLSQWTAIQALAQKLTGQAMSGAPGVSAALQKLHDEHAEQTRLRTALETSVLSAAGNSPSGAPYKSADEAVKVLAANKTELAQAYALGDTLAIKDEKPRSIDELRRVVERLRPAIAVLRDTKEDLTRSHVWLGDIFGVFFPKDDPQQPASRGKVKEWAASVKQLAAAAREEIPVLRQQLEAAKQDARTALDQRDTLQLRLDEAVAAHATQVTALTTQREELQRRTNTAEESLRTVGDELAAAKRTAETVGAQRDELQSRLDGAIASHKETIEALAQQRDEANNRAAAAEKRRDELTTELAATQQTLTETEESLGTYVEANRVLSEYETAFNELSAIDSKALARADAEAYSGLIGLAAYYFWFEQRQLDVKSKKFREWTIDPVFKAVQSRRAKALASKHGYDYGMIGHPFVEIDSFVRTLIELLPRLIKTNDDARLIMDTMAKATPKAAREFLKTDGGLPQPGKLEVALMSSK